MSYSYDTYLSAFTWRYGSQEMRSIFSERHKYLLWRKLWVSLAKEQERLGLVSKLELHDLKRHQNTIDIERILEIEKETHHDVVSAIKEFAEIAKIGGGKIHLGATSMDIVDNADAIRLVEALTCIEKELEKLLLEFSEKIKHYARTPCMGYTHLQPAEPTTIGYRFAMYAQDLLFDYRLLQFVKKELHTKGFKGAVGTAASYVKLFGEKNASILEEHVLGDFNLKVVLIAGQTTPRKIDYFIVFMLCSLAQSLYKFAFDLRIMQSAGFGEWQEPFGKKQVGSSAMPFKKNPIKSEQICSLARLVFALSDVSIGNAAHSLLERTLDDSANRRVYMPELFLATDEIVRSAQTIIQGLIINENRVAKNLLRFGPFSATEEIILEAVKNGANRQEMHELLRTLSMRAWDALSQDQENPIAKLLINNPEIKKYVSQKQLLATLDPKNHLGSAPKRAIKITQLIQKELRR